MKIAPSVAAGGYSLSVTKTKPFIICIIQKQSPGVVLLERCLKKFRKIHRKIPVKEYFLNKVVKKKETIAQVFFPVNFVIFLRTTFYIEHLWWLLLSILIPVLVYLRNLLFPLIFLKSISKSDFHNVQKVQVVWHSSWLQKWKSFFYQR